MIRLYHCANDDSPVSVHQDLLQGHAYSAGQFWDNAEEDRPVIHRERAVDCLKVGLAYYRSLVLWSRWLYGQVMWSPSDCESSEDDLDALADIFGMCAGSRFHIRFQTGKDHKATNACLDAIRNMLVHNFPADKLLHNPLPTLIKNVAFDSRGRNMVRDLLVYGKCADEGWTKKWLENWETAGDSVGWREGESFLASLAQEFAKAKASGDAPDPMARCAYHHHSSDDDQALCGQGV